MTLQEKIKEIADRLDQTIPTPIWGKCFTEVMTSEAGMEFLRWVAKHAFDADGFISRPTVLANGVGGTIEKIRPFEDYWNEFTGATNDNQG